MTFCSLLLFSFVLKSMKLEQNMQWVRMMSRAKK